MNGILVVGFARKSPVFSFLTLIVSKPIGNKSHNYSKYLRKYLLIESITIYTLSVGHHYKATQKVHQTLPKKKSGKRSGDRMTDKPR